MVFYDKLDTFKTVAELGSFSKAAEQLYTTHTSVIKRINSLEGELGITLINRTSKGVDLTPAGECFYADIVNVIKDYNAAVVKAKKLALSENIITVRVGCSLFYPSGNNISLWDTISELYPNIHIKLVMFNDSEKSLADIGTEYDCLIGPFESEYYSEKYSLYVLKDCKISVGISKKSPLSKKAHVSLADLSGRKLGILPEKLTCGFEKVRADIMSGYPNIEVEDISPYIDVKMLNDCADGQFILLMPDCWANLHPSIKCIDLIGDYTYKFGIIHSKKISKEMQIFLDAVQRTI